MTRNPAGSLGFAPVAFDPISAGISVGLMLVTAWLHRRGPKQKVQSTAIVNELEPLLKQNVEAYLAGPRTRTSQAMALSQFDQAWQFLASPEGCGNPELGKPGQNCLAERRRGGTAAWCPTGTGCDWFILYRDPIANDLQVQEYSVLPAELSPAAFAALVPAGIDPQVFMLAIAAALLVMVL